MPGPEVTPGPRGRGPVCRLACPAAALAGVVVIQVLSASLFAGVAHYPVPHRAPVAVAGRSPLAQMVSGRGGGTVRLVAEPARAASRAPQRAARASGAAAASLAA